MIRSPFHLLILALGLLAGFGLLACSDNSPSESAPQAPEVTGASPQQGTEQVSLDAVIMITFNVSMDTASVRAASTLSGSERTQVPFSISWIGNLASFSPLQDFEHNNSYTLSIGTTARSKLGESLMEPYHLSFSTETSWPVVESTLPENGASDVSLNAVCRIEFSQWMDELSTPLAFDISPAVDHATEMIDDDVLQVTFPQSLAPSTIYTVTIDQSAMNDWGESLDESYMFTFSTSTSIDATPPFILGMTPANGQNDVPGDLGEILIEFSEPIDMESLEPENIDARLMVAVTGYPSGDEPAFYWTGNTLHIPVSHLPAGAELFVDFAPFADLAGNSSSDPEPWTFNTAGSPDWYPAGASDWWIYSRHGEEEWGEWSEFYLTRIENISGSSFDLSRYDSDPARAGGPGDEIDPSQFVQLDEVWHQSRSSNAVRLHGFTNLGDGGALEQENFATPIDWLRLPPNAGVSWSGAVDTAGQEAPARVNYSGEVLALEDVPWFDPESSDEGEGPDAIFSDCAKVALSYEMQVQVLGTWTTINSGIDTVWYCAGVGPVKRHEFGTESESQTHESTAELLYWYVNP